jgi:hypothetical protein
LTTAMVILPSFPVSNHSRSWWASFSSSFPQPRKVKNRWNCPWDSSMFHIFPYSSNIPIVTTIVFKKLQSYPFYDKASVTNMSFSIIFFYNMGVRISLRSPWLILKVMK